VQAPPQLVQVVTSAPQPSPPPPTKREGDGADFLESIKQLNAEMKTQMDEHRTALTRCEERMEAGQHNIGLDMVLRAKEELKSCRAQVETLTAAAAAARTATKDDGEKREGRDAFTLYMP
jgi:hypothetical protein